jgi:hypothetical protein
MRPFRTPARIAGLWYLLLVILGPLRLIYIPNKLFDFDDPATTVRNIAAHEWLFRFGMVDDVAVGVVLIFLVLALYDLFEGVSKRLAVQVILFGGVMPALIYFVNVVSDGGALMVVKGPAFLSVFNRSQLDALVVLFLRLHNVQNSAAETLWGVWLIPLGILTYRSRFLPRFLGVWLIGNGVAYVNISLTGLLFPQHSARIFGLSQPALFGELAFMLWLVIMGSRSATDLAATGHVMEADHRLPIDSLQARQESQADR